MKNFFGIILSILIVPIFIILVIYFSISGTLLNAKTIPNIFDKNQLYNTIVTDVLPSMTQSQTDATAIETKNIDPIWLKTQIEKIYQALTDYLKGRTLNLNVTVDLSPLSNILLNTPTDSVTSLIPDEELRKQFDSWSECRSDQTSDCRPPGVSFEDFKTMVDEEIAKQTAENKDIITSSPIPSSYILSSSPTQPAGNAINAVKQSLGLTNIIAYITSAILIFLLLVIFFLFMHEKAKLLKFFGVIFIVSAILLLLLSGGYLTSWRFIANTISSGFNLPTPTVNILINILGAITSNIMTSILITAVIALIGSIICLIFSKKLNINIKKNK